MIDRRALFGTIVLGAAASLVSTRAIAQGAKPKIATIGAGREGGALGTQFAKDGFQVMFSSRNPEQLKDLVAAAGPNAKAGAVADAVAFGDVVLIVVPYTAMDQIAKDYGKALAGKQLVIDVSNPIARRDGEELVKKVNEEGGAGLYTAKLLPGAPLVRAFNAIGSASIAKEAHRSGTPVGVPIAGDDPKAIALASSLIKQIGFEPVLIGGLAKGKYLVPGTALGGIHTPDELRKASANLT
ncbi:MAG TPA: NAD(P)-binding domain-containing protein [Reyranella sp.]|jgi:predicted dinucleotide-binding enzyme|nr:NAD(P)-binding domain-containing protein [Reyranella sp.]